MTSAQGVLHVDREGYRVYVGLEEKHLRLRQFTALCYLIDHAGRACRYYEIALACDIMGRESVQTTMCEVRRVLGQMEGSRIVNVKKYGYRIDIGPDSGTAAAASTTCHDRPPAPGRGAAGVNEAADSPADGPHADSHRPAPPRYRNPGQNPSHPWRR